MIFSPGGLFRRAQWPLGLLLASVALTGTAAIDGYRTVRSQQGVAEGTLRDYAHFAAWSYQQHLRDAISVTVRQALGPVYHGHYMHSQPGYPAAMDLAEYLPWDADCACRRATDGPTPLVYYGFVLNSDTVGAALNMAPDPDRGWAMVAATGTAVPRLSDADRRWVHDTITQDVHSGYRSDWGFTLLSASGPNGRRMVAYTLMPTVWGDTVVYAAEYGATGVASLMRDAFAADGLLPATLARGRPNGTLLWAEVLAADGRPLFISDSAALWQLDATASLPHSDAAVEARVAIRPELANTLVIGGLPRSRLPFLLTLLGLAAALSVVAVAQLRREGELARLRADFVSNVSHELRTPLAQIQLEIETIQLGRAEPAPVRAASLGRIARETRRLTYLADNILRFSRRHRAAKPVQPGATDIAALTAEIIAEFRPLAAGRQVEVRYSIESVAPVAIQVDAFRQLLLNLLDNAIKYGPPGQIVRVCVSAVAGSVLLTVADQGPGVPLDERETIWQPFVRGAAASESAAGGAGIGLTIVHDVVVDYGGRAWVTAASDEGGAAFVVEFPALPPAAGQPLEHTQDETPTHDNGRDGKTAAPPTSGRGSLTGV